MKKLTLTILLLSFLVVSLPSFAQRVGISNNSTYDPDPKAILDLDATPANLGFLAPRMTEINRLSITGPTEGLLVYQTDGAQGFYYWDQVANDGLGSWIRIASGSFGILPNGMLQGDGTTSNFTPITANQNEITYWSQNDEIAGLANFTFDGASGLTLVGDFTSTSIIFDPQGTAPLTPTNGQTYYDSNSDELRVWNGTEWVSLGGGTSTFPLGVVQSDASSNLSGATSTANNVTFWDTDNTIDGSANFTFDGTDLTLTGNHLIKSNTASPNELRLYGPSNTYYSAFTSTADSTVTYNLPSKDGERNAVLSTDASGDLFWQSMSDIGTNIRYQVKIQTTAVDYNATNDDSHIIVNAGSRVQITLPSDVEKGKVFFIKRMGKGDVDICPGSGFDIDGESMVRLSQLYSAIFVVYGGDNEYYIMSRFNNITNSGSCSY